MKTTIIIPTLGNRLNHLKNLINKYKNSEYLVELIVVAPSNKHKEIQEILRSNETVRLIQDNSKGVASAINLALKLVRTEFWNWCGDDDFIDFDKLRLFEEFLDNNPDVSFVYGNCSYVDIFGKTLAVNKPKRFSEILVRYSINLIPQPSVLFRASTYKKIGGLSEHYKYAFDQEYYMRNFSIGKSKYLNQLLSYYTWHEQTLTNENRIESMQESYQIRKFYSKGFISRILVIFFKYPTYFFLILSAKYFKFRSK
jgi:hypothetical protein